MLRGLVAFSTGSVPLTDPPSSLTKSWSSVTGSSGHRGTASLSCSWGVGGCLPRLGVSPPSAAESSFDGASPRSIPQQVKWLSPCSVL